MNYAPWRILSGLKKSGVTKEILKVAVAPLDIILEGDDDNKY
jgi:hypothetical protein